MTKDKILISGGFGGIGSNLVIEILDRELWDVDVVDNMSNGHEEFLNGYKDRIYSYKIDFSDEIILNEIRRGTYKYVFHLAAVPRVAYSCEHPSETTDTNINKTVKLMEACKGNIDRFIFSSSSSVYGGADILPTPESSPKNPASPYALQKSVIEDYCKLFGNLYDFDSVCLRYFNVMGRNFYGKSAYSTAVAAWCQAIKDGKPLRSDGDGFQSRDLCPVQNVVDANILAAQSIDVWKGECFNVACGDSFTNNQILDMFKDKFGELNIIHAPCRQGDVMHTKASIEKIKNVLGYHPRMMFEEALELTWKWWGF